MSEAAILVEHTSKKFCRNLKRSLWYGAQDLTAELLGRRGRGNGCLRRDEFWAVKDLSFELKRGECLGLIGRNGAGKTTLLRMLNGLIKPDAGRIEIRGRVGALIALGAGFNPILTGRENIYINGAVLGLGKREIDAKIDEIIDFSELHDFIDAPLQSYSTGMQVRLGFAVAASLHPDILLLDEVLAVGDMAFQAKCLNTISRYRDKGTIFILVSHNMHHISRYADRVLYLKNGRVSHVGRPDLVVPEYMDDMTGNNEFRKAETPEEHNICGTGKLVMHAVNFVDVHGNKIAKITGNQAVTMRIAYACREPGIVNPLVDIVIRDQLGIFFQGTNEIYGTALNALPEKGFINVMFDAVPANNQQLLFSVAIMDNRTKEVFDWKKEIPLKVTGMSGSHGRVQLQCRWNVSVR